MSFAYRNATWDDKDMIIAANCAPKDPNIRCYCLNPECDAHIYLCNLDNPEMKPYFSATLKEHRHIPLCCYSRFKF